MPVDLKKLSNGKENRPPRVLVYGSEGIGKTGFAAGAPEPFFLDFNRGSMNYDVQRVLPETWTETLEWLAAIENGSVKCKTVVLDVLSDLEHTGNNEFFSGVPIDQYAGGFGKGKNVAIMKWRELLGALERVWLGGKAVVLCAHAKVKHFDDPSGPGYDRFVVSVQEEIAGLVKGWTDYNLFCREDIAHQKVGGDMKAVSTGLRYAFTKRTPAYDAKSRGTTEFPERILLSWNEFSKARAADDERAKTYRTEIDQMLTAIGDKQLETQVKEYLRGNPSGIVEARNRVTSILNDKKPATAAAVSVSTGDTK